MPGGALSGPRVAGGVPSGAVCEVEICELDKIEMILSAVVDGAGLESASSGSKSGCLARAGDLRSKISNRRLPLRNGHCYGLV